MDPKINTILKLLKEKQLEEAKKKCLDIFQKYKKNPDLYHRKVRVAKIRVIVVRS